MATIAQSQRDCVIQPWVAEGCGGLPWERMYDLYNLNEVAAFLGASNRFAMAQPRWGCQQAIRFTQGSERPPSPFRSQPWASQTQSLWD